MKTLLSCLFLLITLHRGRCERIDAATLTNGATCSASSGTCTLAIDSKETPVQHEWITERDAAGAYLFVAFKNTTYVDEIRFLQRCNSADQLKEVKVTFDDGSFLTVGLTCTGFEDALICDDISWESQLFTHRFARSVNITVTSLCSNGGFTAMREVSVMGSTIEVPESQDTNIALAAVGGTCQTSTTNNGEDVCDRALDGAIMDPARGSWVSAPGDTVNAWMHVTLACDSQINTVKIMQDCEYDLQMKRIRVEFDGGSTEYVLSCFNNDTGGLTCADQQWADIILPNIRTSSVNISCLETCSSSSSQVALQEVQVLGVTESDLTCPFDFDAAATLPSCYKFLTASSGSVQDAEAACQALHPAAHLVEIQSLAEQDYIARTVEKLRIDGSPCQDYYINAFQSSNGVWQWNSTGEPLVLPFWSQSYRDVKVEREVSFKGLQGDSQLYSTLYATAPPPGPPGPPHTTVAYPPWATTPPPLQGSYAVMRYFPGAGPYDQWNWVPVSGADPACYVCEIDDRRQ